jgi:2-polyprenyl-3-methyl-5-hydroxy-6-metoxy-1,4-benzoquinol methylase
MFMATILVTSRYHYASAEPPHTAVYLTPTIMAWCRRIGARRVLDLGCGNGALCGELSSAGFEVTGCDPSEEGIALARRAHPHIRFHVLGAYDEPADLGTGFDVVVSTEVIEHLFLPRLLPRFASRVLRPHGHLVLSTPYHGYLKNLLLSLSGKWDRHFSPLWDGGHIKFWSRTTLTELLTDEGFSVAGFAGAGRLPYLWKSMILVCRKG